MAKPTGFMEYARSTVPYRSSRLRVLDFEEIYTEPPRNHLHEQSARCMDCGVPFCQSETGCPIDNLIPEWNDLVYQERWQEALDRLHSTNNFPEFTGRVCPAPCEGACVLGLTDKAVTIKNIESAIVDRGFAEGWIQPRPPAARSGKTVAIVGSGPAGLAAADQLNRAGHQVTVFERADRPGGLLMYGIPKMKLDKGLIERRLELLHAEGVLFKTRVHVGPKGDWPEAHINHLMGSTDPGLSYVDPDVLAREFDAVLLATGATQPRLLPIEGAGLRGIHPAMDFLTRTTQHVLDGGDAPPAGFISATDRDVIVIGGGDTGTDCIATATRQNCRSLVNFELLGMPGEARNDDNPWPEWPRIMRVDYGHEEANARWGHDPRRFSILTKRFLDDGSGQVAGVETVRVDWSKPSDTAPFSEVPNSSEIFPAQLVLLALGFVGPEHGVSSALGLGTDARSNYATTEAKGYQTARANVFAAGDCRRGQSLVVWAIQEGRAAAAAIDDFLLPNQP